MNFSESQKTGRIAELDVERLFTSWGWIVGHDHIDEGYDLHVEPDRTRYSGARFLVQVKGTARSKSKGVVAQVAKNRLRQYADNPIPVVIVRCTSDGTLYWIHAQEWARANEHKLGSNGASGVRFDKFNRLSDRAAFEAFLTKVLESPARRRGALAELAQERSRYLSSLDARLRVRTSVTEGREQHEIFAVSEDVDATFEFQPDPEAQNIKTLRETIDFGLPGEVKVGEFQLSGSPVFEAIGANREAHGTLSIQAANPDPVMVELRPGKKRSIFSPEISIPAQLFRGHEGVAISNGPLRSLFDLTVKIPRKAGRGRADATFGIRREVLSYEPLRDIKALAPLVLWADGVLREESLTVELLFLGQRAPMTVPKEGLRSMQQFFLLARTFGKIHLVAKALDSAFVLPLEYDLCSSDVSDIDLAFALLKGERCPIEIGPIDIETAQTLNISQSSQFLITTTISFSIADQPLCDIPVKIELVGFSVDDRNSSNQLKLLKGEHGQAWMSQAEHDVIDGEVRRVEKPESI